MAFLQVAEDDFSLPGAFILRVHDYFVAVPWFDSGHDTLALHSAERYIAGPGARRFFFMAFR